MPLKKLFFLSILLSTMMYGDEDSKLSTLYNSLDPQSISKLLAFYELYPNSSYGQKALLRVWDLVTLSHPDKESLPKNPLLFPHFDILGIITLVNKTDQENATSLNKEQLEIIDKLASPFKNRKLKGYAAKSPEEILHLPSEDIDLARGLLLWQFQDSPNTFEQIRQYEATLDLMTLQILAKLPKNATSKHIIEAINTFIFYEMQFRFPPHSLMVENIDLYTFLPSVLDSRQGVCLGVSILYLCLAQRLGIELEIITPPGHIFVRLHEENQNPINIETTARGVHMPTTTYLGINTYELPPRTVKEVIGMAFVNQASLLLEKHPDDAVKLYEKASLFMPTDPLTKMLLSIAYLQTNETTKAKLLLEQIRSKPFPGQIYQETLPEDFINKKTNAEGLKIIFEHVDETRESILSKQKHLQDHLKKYPHFRAGLMHLAVTYLQLGRAHEALETLKKYHALDSKDPIVNYYLCVLSMERLQYEDAWKHYYLTYDMIAPYHHMPRTLQSLKFHLRQIAPSLASKG